jgi:hypothetical protein
VYDKETLTPARLTKRVKKSHAFETKANEHEASTISYERRATSADGHGSGTTIVQNCQSIGRNSDEDIYLSIPKDLRTTLANVYFRHVYNAGLLLHRPSFLRSIEDGSSSPHIVLSVCAWGAKYAAS